MFVSLFLMIFLCYWIDKCFCNLLYLKIIVLSYYKIPPKYDLSLSKKFAIMLLFGVIIHCGFAIYIFGSPQLVADVSIIYKTFLFFINLSLNNKASISKY